MAKTWRFAAATLLTIGTFALTWVQPAGAVGQPVDTDTSGWLTVAHVSPAAAPAGQDLSLEVEVRSGCAGPGFGLSCSPVDVELHQLAPDGSEVIDARQIDDPGLLTVGTVDFTVPAAALAPPTFSYWFEVGQTRTACGFGAGCTWRWSEVRAPRIGTYEVVVLAEVS